MSRSNYARVCGPRRQREFEQSKWFMEQWQNLLQEVSFKVDEARTTFAVARCQCGDSKVRVAVKRDVQRKCSEMMGKATFLTEQAKAAMGARDTRKFVNVAREVHGLSLQLI